MGGHVQVRDLRIVEDLGSDAIPLERACEYASQLRPGAQQDQGDGGITDLVVAAAQVDALAASGDRR